MVNVFHINSNYLTSRLHENLVEKLENKGIHNTIYMPVKKETIDEFLYESRFDVKAPVTFKDRDKFIFTWKQHKIIRKMEELYDFKTIDIIHAHTLFTDGNVAHYLSEKYDIPYVVTVRGMTDIDGFFKKRINLRARGRRILKDASRIVFLSEANKQTLLSEYIKNDRTALQKKSKVIPNGIDDFWFEHEYRPKEMRSDKSVDLLYVGKLKKSKNAPSVVEAMRILKDKYDIEANATFIGKIVDQDIHDELAAVEDVPVKLLPPAGKDVLLDLYRNSDIFIMPSYSETFGLVYPEAMSQGLPVIYSKGQGFDGQFQYGQVGFPVDPYEPEDIADRLADIIKDYKTISTNAIEKYKLFNWQTISEEHKENYAKVLQDRKEANID
ncbi:Glycosyltransferase involved in cell wall bisynthesis [Alkalibacterium subtropicum]|uniref:Glycosyltransferase involved in cell wall bisynthesis n=1 Tax=Alkalibacterium subtropicum TaxID=753702 RepID=A0A1I1GI59_9LACT|nr:glycosyltransferase family 4 protein [Alkalibacterium subtropicum]SFC11244.1 Glycosyltransferase involved in cell wall bisynthesis [Alkalibacterium subtropicum]